MKLSNIVNSDPQETEENSKNNFFERQKNILKDKAKKDTKKALKKMVKILAKLIKHLFALIFGKTFMIVLVVIILLGASLWIVTANKSKKGSEANSTSISYSANSNRNVVQVAVDENDSSYSLTPTYVDNIEEEKLLTDIKEDLENEGIDSSEFTDYELKYLGILRENGLEYSNYTEEELKLLILFGKSEIASNLLDLRKEEEMLDENGNYKKVNFENLEEDQVYGTIQVKRTNAKNETSQHLTYINEEKFNQYIENSNEEVLKYFTIDENNNLVLAEWTKDTIKYSYEGNVPESEKKQDQETYNMTSVKLAYKEYISKYTMHFNFLSSLMTIIENKEFCSEVAKLGFDNEIVIEIKEEGTVYETKIKEDYEPKYRSIMDLNYTVYELSGRMQMTQEGQQVPELKKSAKQKHADTSRKIDKENITIDEWQNNPLGVIIVNSDTAEEKYSITETTLVETNQYSVGITKADTWIINYEAKHEKKDPEQELQEGESEDQNLEEIQELTEYLNFGSIPMYAINDMDEFYSKDNIPLSARTAIINYKKDNYDDKRLDLDRLTVGKFNISKVTTKIDTTKTTYSLTESVKSSHIYSRNENDELEKFLLLYSKYIGEDEISEWFFSMLEREPNTEYLSNVMRYLFYKYNGIDYGVTSEEDLDLVNLNTLGFSNLYTGSRGNYISGEGIGVKISNFARMFVNEAANHGYDLLYCQTNRNSGFYLKPYSGARYPSSDNGGTPLKPDATNDLTFDCSSFVSFIYKHTLFPNLISATTSNMESEFSQYFENIGKYNSSLVQPGDIILYHGRFNHVMLYVGNNEIIHAVPSTNGGIVTFDGLSYVDKYCSSSVILRLKSDYANSTPNTTINWPNGTTSNLEEIMSNSLQITDDEFSYFERLVLAEAGNEGYEGMLAVAAVVVNRAKSNEFPDTIVGVINQPRQFSTVENKNGTNLANIPLQEKPGKQALANVSKAVSDALNGADNVSCHLNGTAVYFQCHVRENMGKTKSEAIREFEDRLEKKYIYYINYNTNTYSTSHNTFTYKLEFLHKPKE